MKSSFSTKANKSGKRGVLNWKPTFLFHRQKVHLVGHAGRPQNKTEIVLINEVEQFSNDCRK